MNFIIEVVVTDRFHCILTVFWIGMEFASGILVSYSKNWES